MSPRLTEQSDVSLLVEFDPDSKTLPLRNHEVISRAQSLKSLRDF